MNHLAREKIDLLRQNARSVVRELGLLNDAYFSIGVTLAERHLLIELNAVPYPTVGEIAERLLLDKSTASRLISKAVKKGYIAYASDENDKRKRFLHLTEKGREVLDAFEPIAFRQTQEALLTLTEKEVAAVYQGIALYAKGLKNARLRQQISLSTMATQDHAAVAHLLGMEAWDNLLSRETSYFVVKMGSVIIGGAGITRRSSQGKPTCWFEKIRLQSTMRHLGLEKMVLTFCLQEAKRLGYTHCYIDTAKEALLSHALLEELGFKTSKQQDALRWKTC